MYAIDTGIRTFKKGLGKKILHAGLPFKVGRQHDVSFWTLQATAFDQLASFEGI